MTPTPRESSRRIRQPADGAAASAEPSVFVSAPEAPAPSSRRWRWYGLALLLVIAVAATGVLIAWPRLNPKRLDPVERVAEDYLKALAGENPEAARRLATLDEPPAIRSVHEVRRNRGGGRLLKGSFAPLGELHSRIATEFDYDAGSGRFTPKNALGAAAETMDALHAAKEDAEKSGLYKNMQSGDPEELFDAAEQFGKVFTKLAEGALAPKRILPSYQMLVESAKPPLADDAKALALEAAGSMKDWDALLKRSFHTLKADGPFIYELAAVTATVTDRLASSGDPPTRLRLTLVRFRLEGIDTGWKVVAARRIVPGAKDAEVKPTPSASPPASESQSTVPAQPPVNRRSQLLVNRDGG